MMTSSVGFTSMTLTLILVTTKIDEVKVSFFQGRVYFSQYVVHLVTFFTL